MGRIFVETKFETIEFQNALFELLCQNFSPFSMENSILPVSHEDFPFLCVPLNDQKELKYGQIILTFAAEPADGCRRQFFLRLAVVIQRGVPTAGSAAKSKSFCHHCMEETEGRRISNGQSSLEICINLL
jgi:hypothetical protein